MSAACFLAKEGHHVTVCEKNRDIGGRARVFREAGFTFDMGPSWYWMPDVFESFFAAFGKKPADYYDLVQLDPGFQVIFAKDDVLQIPASLDGICATFENIEKGSAEKLKKFLEEGAFKYRISMNQFIYRPSFSWMEFANLEVVSATAKLHVFKSVSYLVRKYFKDERLIALMEFPVLFLGATAKQIPALYTLMNYAALSLGTWYPMGGMGRIVEGMAELASSLGVEIRTSCEVERIVSEKGRVSGLQTSGGLLATDGVIASADYHHVENDLLDNAVRNYPESYWPKRTFAPSCLIFFLGVSKKIKKLIHHNLFFHASLDQHAKELYEAPQWPSDPLFYVCCPSKTDTSVAPEGMENLFVLIPIAAGLQDTAELREQYFSHVVKKMEVLCNEDIASYIVYRKSYCVNDFVTDYNAYKGNAYGLANTLRQTAVLKPTLRNKKLKNLFYAGQLSVPGPGVPPALISGQIAAKLLADKLKNTHNEETLR